MRNFVRFLMPAVVGLAFASTSSAATMVIVDPFGPDSVGTTWTLEVQENCQVGCSVTLEAYFADPGAGTNAYTGTYLDSVQWKVGGATPTSVTLTSTTAGNTTDWEFDIDESLNANQCSGGANDAVCGEWISGGTFDGFGPIVNDSTLTWTFSVNWEELLGTPTVGNIRAAFNDDELGKNGKVQNFNIFSPGGGTFTPDDDDPDGGGDDPIVPEPTLLTLLGGGLVLAARRLHRKNR